MNGLMVAGTSIRRDAEGRYCLNDCHKAAGADPTKRPGEWARNSQTAALVAELTNAGNPAISVLVRVAGRTGGTYVVKELVYAYAMWISPSFHLSVIRAFDGLVTGAVQAAVPALPQTHVAALRDLADTIEQEILHCLSCRLTAVPCEAPTPSRR